MNLVCLSTLVFFLVGFAEAYNPKTLNLDIYPTGTAGDNITSIITHLRSTGYDVWKVFQKQTHHRVVVRCHTLEEETALKHQMRHHSLSFRTLQQESLASGQDKFSDLPKMEQRIRALESKYPNIAKVHEIGKSQEENRVVYAVKIAANPFQDNVKLPEVVITGIHHAREWISAEVAMGIAEHVCAAFATNRKIRRILSLTELWVIPVMNPDGFAYTFQKGYDSEIRDDKRLWRKNRRNGYGVDPNRNYDSHWGGRGSSGDIHDETFRGASAFSEAETLNIRRLLGDRRNNVTAALQWLSDPIGFLSYHSFGNQLLYPIGGVYQSAPNEAFLKGITGQMRQVIIAATGVAYESMKASQTYLADGDACDWFMEAHEYRPAITIELRPEEGKCCDFAVPGDQIEDVVKEGIVSSLYFSEYLGVEGPTVSSWAGHQFRSTSDANKYDADENGFVDYTQLCYGQKCDETAFFLSANRTRKVVLYPVPSINVDVEAARLELATCAGVLLYQVNLVSSSITVPTSTNGTTTTTIPTGETWITFPNNDLLPADADVLLDRIKLCKFTNFTLSTVWGDDVRMAIANGNSLTTNGVSGGMQVSVILFFQVLFLMLFCGVL